jgi:ATP-dependent RNA helicase DDX3X
LPDFLAANLRRMKYTKPTPIQKHAIPLIMAGRDVLCAAQTGSGKTLAFLLPTVFTLETSPHGGTSPAGVRTPARPRALVLAPTRELASQIHGESMKLTFAYKTRCLCVYGGTNAREQLQALASGVDLLIATPGRLTDFLERDLVYLGDCCTLILDEADRMLDMGFKPQIDRIMRSGMPPRESRRTFMFSATFPAEIQRLAELYMRPYVYVAVGRVGSTTESITQRLILVSDSSKQGKLQLLYETLSSMQAACSVIVFVQKKRTATVVCKSLKRDLGINAVEIHGDRSQSQRESALADFRSGFVRVLVATDVAARGLDIPNVEHVVNYDLPASAEEFDSYIHRIGRTGRAGNTGTATSFFVPGFSPKVGNGALAVPLIKLLRESGQEVPTWLDVGGGGAKSSVNDLRATPKDVRVGQTAFKFAEKMKPEPTRKLSSPPVVSASVSALPAGWEEYVDPSSGNVYFANKSTGQSQWEKPQIDRKPQKIQQKNRHNETVAVSGAKSSTSAKVESTRASSKADKNVHKPNSGGANKHRQQQSGQVSK